MLKPKGQLVRVNVTIDADLLDRFDASIAKLNLRRSQALTELIKTYLKGEDNGSD
jgi:metal-responsive CopG/Arc/MetJ family transcriptional regulator